MSGLEHAVTLAEALTWARGRLDDRLEAEVLLAHVLGATRSHLYTWPEQQLSETQVEDYRRLIERRAAGEPVAYLTGRQEFWSLELEVDAATLIPRPETEHLVELALQRVAARDTVLDLGTGTGAVALAIAHERPEARVTAVDASAAALAVAHRNAARLKLDLELLEGDWYAPVRERRFHVIVSNPPYIGEAEPELSQGDCRFEPRSALVADGHGLADLRLIAAGAPKHLYPGGWLLVEHGYRQGAAVRELFRRAGFVDVASERDLAGHERVTLGRLPDPGTTP